MSFQFLKYVIQFVRDLAFQEIGLLFTKCMEENHLLLNNRLAVIKDNKSAYDQLSCCHTYPFCLSLT